VGVNKVNQILGAKQHPGPEFNKSDFPGLDQGSHRVGGDVEEFRRLIDIKEGFTIADHFALLVFHILILTLI
jgi:hypothetical protein